MTTLPMSTDAALSLFVLVIMSSICSGDAQSHMRHADNTVIQIIMSSFAMIGQVHTEGKKEVTAA